MNKPSLHIGDKTIKPAHPDKPKRIIVVSDQAIFRRGLTSFLMGIKGVQLVGEASDGEEALQLSAMVNPDLVLLDLKRPIGSGRSTARQIIQRWPKTQVVVLEDVVEDNLGQDDPDLETAFFFCKDILEEELTEAIQRIAQVSLGQKSKKHIKTAIEDGTTEPHQSADEVRAREMLQAGRVQADILPEKAPTIPGWDISCGLESARETSGDFFDFIPLPNGNWGVVVADVTDKGMGAALFMALSSTLIRTYAVRYPTLPALTMDVVNERILSDTRDSMFVTAFFGVLEPDTGRLRFVNAGHPPGFLFSSLKGKSVSRLSATGIPLGVSDGTHWRQKIVRFVPGDVLVLYTDGVTEAQNAIGDFFGEQRIVDLVRSKRGGTAKEIQDALFKEVRRFVGNSRQQDDIALIVVRRE